MNQYKFKTNINCGACVAKVTPHLNEADGVKNWEVDVKNPQKILTVTADGVDADRIKEIVKKAGFEAEKV
jgi:copper chaperone CopZ